MTDLETFARGLHVRVCPIYRLDRQRAFLVGTGVPLATDFGEYIITASHVIDELPDHMLVTAGSKSLVRFPARILSFEHIEGKTADVDIGLARLPVEATRDLSLRYQFTRLEECGLVANYDKFTLYAVVGYPHSRNKPNRQAMPEIRATPTFLILREFSDVSRLASSGKRSDVHFALHAPRTKIKGFDWKPVAIPKLQGMSVSVSTLSDGTMAKIVGGQPA